MIGAFWHWLTRPRGRVPHRFHGVARNRKSQRGIALLMAITTIAFMTVLVTEINYAARVRLLMSAHARDEAIAEGLARSGANLYRLILMADREITSSLSSFMPSLNLSLWEMIPMINTGLLRMMFASNGSPDEDELETFTQTGQVSEEVREESMEGGRFSDRNFLEFDGDFFAEVTDEDSKVNVNLLGTSCGGPCTYAQLREDPVAIVLFGLMSGQENDQWFYERNLDRWELIANLADWIDLDTTRCAPQGGNEDNLYNRFDPPYLSKNAQFRTKDEIRLVEGWQDEVYNRFGDKLTIWSDKINVNTASDEMLCGLVRSLMANPPIDEECKNWLEAINTERMGMPYTKESEFIQELKDRGAVDADKEALLTQRLKVRSSLFRVESVGQVGDTTTAVTAIFDFSSSSRGRIRYWRVE